MGAGELQELAAGADTKNTVQKGREKMTVLMRYRQDGHWPKRCNASCYNATGTHCKCICQGKNHGKGIKQAAKNALDRQQNDHRQGISFNTIEIKSILAQQDLFPEKL